MCDFVIVGQGLAGTFVALELIKRGKTVKVYDDDEFRSSSRVAAGIFNPITGHRMVKTWMADDLFTLAESYYPNLENDWGAKFYHTIGLSRVFQNAEQFNDVQGKLVDHSFASYLSNVGENQEDEIINDYGATLIKRGGWLDVKEFLRAARAYLIDQGSFELGQWDWENSEAQKVIMCQGHRAIFSSDFSWLKFAVTKGEILVVHCPGAPQKHILNKGFWMVPKGDGIFLAGASFSRTTDKEPTPKGRAFVEQKMRGLLKCNYTVLDHYAAVRPTVADRRPLLGEHPSRKNLYIFNGLGTKGVTLGPFFASHFCDFLLEGKDLMDEVNINRFLSLFNEVDNS